MQYLIRHKENKMYYAKDISKNYHFVEYSGDAYIFKNKWEANRKLKELGSNFEVIKK